jgi:hypothetical protein
LKKFNRPNKRQVFATVAMLSILGLAGYTVWQTYEIRTDIGALYDKSNQQAEEAQYFFSEEKGDTSGITYKVLKQYVEKLEVQDPEFAYNYDQDIAYIEKNVRVVELEITNNNEWVYSSYSSIGTIDDSGKITRSISTLNPSQDKNYNPSGYSLELAPGGVGTVYLYLEDNGSEITRLYDIDNSTEIQTN